uniref:26S proteasome non-ATPase regulatory subunit 2 n=1 Tax=Timema tahoe TaxID=61484 RepID=A0A7R9FGD8_9NEOP|nr:unnamed protein product [Timema tahoe]
MGSPPGSKSPCDDDVLTVAARRRQTDPVAPRVSNSSPITAQDDLQGLRAILFHPARARVRSIRKQLAFLLGRQQVVLDLDEFQDGSDLKTVMSNAHINDHFLNMARELDIMEPKTPEDVYKTWLENLVMRPTFLAESNVDSARKNLASTFVNAFVNAGFGSDKLVTGEDGKNWIYRNKEHGKMSAAASLGLIHLWDVDGGLSPIDRYLYSNDDYITSGALLALGIVNCGVRNECDPAQALLMDYVLHSSNTLRIGSILGLGLAYAGSCRQDVVELIVPVLGDSHSTREAVAIAALACSLITVGFGSSEVTSPILQALMDMGPEDLENTYSRFLPLALGICYLGQKDAIEATSATLEVLPESFRSMAQTMLQICAYAGTGDVLMIQELLHICSEHYSQEEKDESILKNIEKKESEKNLEGKKKHDLSSMQGVATLGVALIAMGEEIGNEMSTRIFGNLGRYGESSVRKAVPLAIALSSLSNPVLAVCDVLNKYSHDIDEEVAYNAVLCMGLVGAGTNNARLATMLRHLAQYHVKNPTLLFMVRLAQGLVHMGKGTLSLSPFHSDHQIMSPVALAGLLIVLVACLDVKNLILGQSHYLLYCLVTAIQPRWLVTLDEELRSLAVPVRVGQVVDIVGKAGTPKTITGTNTHNTPVLLAVGERAELATEEYTPLSPMLEGIVILRKNPVVA